MNKIDSLKNKILYRSNYRGTKEMDLLLNKFVNKYINTLSEDELISLNEFLNLEDEEILNFYHGRIKKENPKNSKILDLFKRFRI
tara:strand:+ start:384 stop:638 length:255 start_codon:yes stop_codon:yes gene_type:complete